MARDMLSLVGFVSISLYLTINGTKLYFLFRRLGKAKGRQGKSIDFNESPLRITIMQPILSGDSRLHEVLLQNVMSLGSTHQFLWLIDASDAIGMEIGKSIESKYPNAVQIISCPDCPPDINPKAYKLDIGLVHSVTNIVGVMDDDTAVDGVSLSVMLDQLKDYDLVTALPKYIDSEGLWSGLVSAWVNSQACLTYLPIAECSKELSINGMFYLARKSTLTKHKIFSEIQSQLCDDYAVASVLRKAGCNFHQSEMLVQVQTTIESGRNYFTLMHRWMVFASCLIIDQTNRIKFLLVLFLVLPSVLIWGSWCTLALGWPGLIIQFLFLVLRHFVSQFSLSHVSAVRSKLSFLHALLAEHLQLVHSIAAIMNRNIRWRSRRIKVRLDGKMEFLG